jgi:hypothetical protein
MRLFAPALLLTLSGLAAQELSPQIATVSPRVVKPGDTVTVTGVALSDARIDEVYLSDHKFDMKVKVLDQNEKAMRFRVPPFAKGRLQLLILMKPEKDGEDPKLLELPAYLLVEELSQEITQVQAPAKGKKTTQQDQPKDQQKQ